MFSGEEIFAVFAGFLDKLQKQVPGKFFVNCGNNFSKNSENSSTAKINFVKSFFPPFSRKIHAKFRSIAEINSAKISDRHYKVFFVFFL